MTQADFTIANQTFPNTRTELNTSLQALATNSAGNSAPSTTFPSQWHFDSDGNQLYIRNKDNDAWVEVFSIGATTDKIDTIADNIFIGTSGQLGVGIAPALALHVSSGADNVTARFESTDTEVAIELKDTTGTAIIASRNDFRFTTGGSETARLDTSGKLLIGDSASHTTDLFQIETPASGGGHGIQIRRNDANTDQQIGTISFGNNTDTDLAQILVRTDGDSNSGDSGTLTFKTQPTGGASTERMRITSAGNVGIGTTSPNFPLDVVSDSSANGIQLRGRSADNIAQFSFESNDSGTVYSQLQSLSTELKVKTIPNIKMSFHTNSTERMVIRESGPLGFGRTAAQMATNCYAHFYGGEHSYFAYQFENAETGTNSYTMLLKNNYAADDNASEFFRCQDGGAARLIIFADGDIKNHDNAYGSISDERIKQDIVDSNSQWNDIKAVKVRNYKKKDDVRQYGDNAWSQIGVIAQELETVSPKLIRHSDPNPSDILSSSAFGTLYTSDDAETQDAVLYTSDDQEVIDGDKNVGDIKTPSTAQIGEVKEIKEQVKSVNYSILYMKAIKALQEAMTKIEDLQARVTTLEG